jgi:hypothetical protein
VSSKGAAVQPHCKPLYKGVRANTNAHERNSHAILLSRGGTPRQQAANPCRQETQKRAPNSIGHEDAHPRHHQHGSRGGSTLRGASEDEAPNDLLEHYRENPVQSARKGERGERAGEGVTTTMLTQTAETIVVTRTGAQGLPPGES